MRRQSAPQKRFPGHKGQAASELLCLICHRAARFSLRDVHLEASISLYLWEGRISAFLPHRLPRYAGLVGRPAAPLELAGEWRAPFALLELPTFASTRLASAQGRVSNFVFDGRGAAIMSSRENDDPVYGPGDSVANKRLPQPQAPAQASKQRANRQVAAKDIMDTPAARDASLGQPPEVKPSRAPAAPGSPAPEDLTAKVVSECVAETRRNSAVAGSGANEMAHGFSSTSSPASEVPGELIEDALRAGFVMGCDYWLGPPLGHANAWGWGTASNWLDPNTGQPSSRPPSASGSAKLRPKHASALTGSDHREREPEDE
jgi:hypothetical protein